MMRRALTALTLVAVTALGAVVFAMGNASAWKCATHPEKAPYCTTTTGPPVSVSQPDPSTSVPTTTVPATTTSTTPVPPEVTLDPPTVIRLAG